MEYLTNIALTIMFLALDIIATGFSNTLHMEKDEDIGNIIMIALHGGIVMCSFGMIYVSVSQTIKFQAGLFGELLKMTSGSIVSHMVHLGVMPMPWVYRRWILKGTSRKLYWDDTFYVIVNGIHVVSLFAAVYCTMGLQCQLTDPRNYNTRGPKMKQMSVSWLLEGRKGSTLQAAQPAFQ
eukprot:TRINITY_DN20993_c0_g1_i2.p1 TRINITY_DN20993_c0_g1~~TRINITY_DN20993_c0_g1_i2.p1  ORF type:complete len:180 (+),score=22.22 TRINITY_DN20993_c0_g1_i2:73-612(+)